MNHLIVPGVLTSAAVLLTGCAAAPRTESLQTDDILFTATQAADRLVASDFFSQRGGSSPKAAITTRRAEVIARLQLTEGERWYLVDKVAAAAPVESLRARNISFVIPEERARAAAIRDPLTAFPPDRRPTHVLSATLRSANRSSLEAHAAYYLVEYRLLTLPAGEVVWSDIVEFKREAAGKTFD